MVGVTNVLTVIPRLNASLDVLANIGLVFKDTNKATLPRKVGLFPLKF